MFENKKSESEKGLDDFWNIEKLIPTTKQAASESKRKNVYFDTETAEISLRPSERKAKSEICASTFSGDCFTRFIPPHTAEELEARPIPTYEYIRKKSLIHNVKIFQKHSKYNFYEKFFEDAKKYASVIGKECPAVPFFSYTPQYEQLNRSQLAYYLWWRENVRNGVYIDVDYSYIMLYLYELINLSDISDKHNCLDMLCNIWLQYGKKHAFINKYLGEWVCDFCLIYNLPVPADKLKPIYSDIMKNCLIKEFYVVSGDSEAELRNICAETLVSVASSYDYRNSRYATQDRVDIMEKHLIGAVNTVLEKGLFDDFRSGISKNTAERNAYSGALCTPSVRRRIEISYYSFSRSYELRYLVGDVLKYSENKLRKHWGIKSRLNIYALPLSIKKCIDEYFELLFMQSDRLSAASFKSKKGNGAFPNEALSLEYEKFYDAPNEKLSIKKADDIERESWETTKILVEAFDEDKSSPTLDEPEDFRPKCVSNDTVSHGSSASLKRILGEKYSFLMAVKKEDLNDERIIASRLSYLPDALVDEINEIASDLLGDIIIEDGDNGYRVVEEYRALID